MQAQKNLELELWAFGFERRTLHSNLQTDGQEFRASAMF